MTTLWIGTYPSAGAGTPVGLGEGVWSVELDAATGQLSGERLLAATPSPSFLAVHADGRTLYAVNEHSDGTVTAFDVTPDGLRERGSVPSGGDDPCHVVVDGDTLLVANYSSGTLAAIPLDATGGFAGDATVLGHVGSGPNRERQESPHAHFVALDPGGRHVLVVDLGTDEIRRYRRTDDGLVPDGIAMTFAPGTGPRHLAFAPDGLHAYVVGELDNAVHVLEWRETTGTLVQSVPVATDSLLSHVLLDGERLLVGVRISDTIAELTVGADGLLAEPVHHRLPGGWPRHHEVVDGWTVVAEQVGAALTVLGPDGAVASRLDLPAPACVVRAR
ncbi:lactonase family protein [Cellulomonas edaphi]|uniref:Beta-propeller fold lactonase family protein n=1 Tax=Cellulomonas edaphi TaxID=3053468 RepID=A0ABT7S5X5_9CELL|nr:beta-propeller fold lactonase family protein [Cellulomons edaphi]MDM7830452.1 beta-propeller fold lactonase family protein [Cellulomons edaphi]